MVGMVIDVKSTVRLPESQFARIASAAENIVSAERTVRC